MRNFVVFFTGKEGSSPLMHLLDNFPQVSIIRSGNPKGGGLEPFDQHQCGPMSDRDLRRSLEMVLGGKGLDLEKLNRIYLKTSRGGSINEVREGTALGFKMRPKFPRENHFMVPHFFESNEGFARIFRRNRRQSFLKMARKILEKTGAVAFFALRQDLLRWSLSRYHGDGSCRPGNMQFKLAEGKISRDDIGKIAVDCGKLEQIIAQAEQMLAGKMQIVRDFRACGIEAHPLFYEDFLEDKVSYFTRLFRILEIDITVQDIENALDKGAYFQKVHSSDISEFVVNHEEVLERFSGYQYLG